MSSTVSRSTDLGPLTKNSDVMMAIGVIGILIIMIIPLPSWLLDILLSCNITFSIIVLLVGMYTVHALEFSVFPSLLLVTTLFRLSLNIASTRLILFYGNEGSSAAGQVIKAFGSFVVGGNYVVGMVVFAILVIINFVVITKGAGRIAEVAARFTLDAMPGKQMSIDADLNAGLIDDTEARQRRKRIEEEADFYGAMDGASKFVRGDAIAGIIITIINILGGLVIGVLQKGLPVSVAAQNYTLLTVGDGLVSQIPALIISTAAGIIVTRAASESHLGSQMLDQITFHPRAIAIAAGILFVFALVPGLPQIPFMGLAGLAGFIAYVTFQGQKASMIEKIAKAEEPSEGPEHVESLLPIDEIELEVGYGLIPLVDKEQGGELLERIRSIRRQFALDMGVVVPPVHIRDNLKLSPSQYCFLIKGVEMARGEMMLDHYLAMDSGTTQQKIDGIPTKEPAFGLPALWITKGEKDRAQMLGYTVVDPSTVLATHISELIKTYVHELLGRQQVQTLLDHVAEKSPKVVDELIPNLLPLGSVQKVLQNLLKERVSIRDLLTILETLADYAPSTKNTDILTEYVRQRLGRTITRQYLTEDGELYLITLDPQVEDILNNALQHTERESFLSIEPGLAQKIITNIQKMAESFAATQSHAVLLTSPTIRIHLRKLVEKFIPNLTVLSHAEIDPKIKIQSLGMVST